MSDCRVRTRLPLKLHVDLSYEQRDRDGLQYRLTLSFSRSSLRKSLRARPGEISVLLEVGKSGSQIVYTIITFHTIEVEAEHRITVRPTKTLNDLSL
jgi:hypothetical protein